MSRDRILHPAATLALMLGVTLAWLGIDLLAHGSAAGLFDEGRAIEALSVVMLLAAAALWWLGGGDPTGGAWHIPAILILMALRELDMDKRFTSEGVLQLRLYSGPSPWWEKAAGLAVVALILVCGWRLARITLPRWWRDLRRGAASAWLALAAAAMIVTAKSLDGVERKLAGLGIGLDPSAGSIAGRAEELLELAAFILLAQAVACLGRARQVAGRAAPGRAARRH